MISFLCPSLYRAACFAPTEYSGARIPYEVFMVIESISEPAGRIRSPSETQERSPTRKSHKQHQTTTTPPRNNRRAAHAGHANGSTSSSPRNAPLWRCQCCRSSFDRRRFCSRSGCRQRVTAHSCHPCFGFRAGLEQDPAEPQY